MTINQREAVTEQYDTVPAGAHTVVAGEHLVPGQEYRPEGAARRLHRWVRHAPHERLPLVSAPVIWTAAEIMHAAAASDWMGPGVVTVLAAARAYAKAARGAARRTASGEHPGLDGAEMGTAVGVPLAWLTAAVKLGPLWGPYDVMTSVFFAGIYTLGYWWWRGGKACCMPGRCATPPPRKRPGWPLSGRGPRPSARTGPRWPRGSGSRTRT